MEMAKRALDSTTKTPARPRRLAKPAVVGLLAIVAFFLSASAASAAPPANDDFANAIAMSTSLPTTENGTTVEATMQPGEPEHSGVSFGGGTSVWYSYTPTTSVAVHIDTCSSGSPSALGVYTGATVDALTRVGSDTFCGLGQALNFDALGGTTYWIAVDSVSFIGGPGPFTLKLRVLNPPANDDFANAQSIAGAPPSTTSGTTVDATAEPNEPGHAGSAPLTSAWYSWTAPSTGDYVIETCGTDSGGGTPPPASGGQRLAIYTGSSLTTLSPEASADANCNGARVTLGASAGTTYRIAVDISSFFTPAAFDLSIRASNPPPNDDFIDAEAIASAVPSSTPGTTVDATAEPGEPNHTGFFQAQNSVWYEWTPPASGNYALSTCQAGGISGGTAIAVYTGTDVALLTQEAGPPPSPTCGSDTGARVTLAATLGMTYEIAVDTNDLLGTAQTGPFTLKITDTTPPPNDDFASSEPIASAVPSSTDGTTLDATAETDEPDHGGSPAQSSVWYSWSPPTTGNYRIDTCGGGNNIVALYTGSDVATLSPVATGSATCASGGSAVALDADASTTYRIAVEGGSLPSDFSLAIRAPNPPANDDLANAATIPAAVPSTTSGTTLDATVETGEPSHSGFFPAIASVWYSWTPADSGSYSLSTCSTTSTGGDQAIGAYTGSAYGSLTAQANGFGGCPSGAVGARVTLSATSGTTYRIAVDGTFSQGPFDLKISSATGGPAPDTSFTSGPANGSTINDPQPTFAFTSTVPGSTFACQLDGGSYIPCSSPQTIPFPLSDAAHTVSVRATEPGGITDPTPATRTFTVDTVAPDTSFTSGPSDGSTITTDSTSFGFSSSEAGSTFECKLDTAAFAACTNPKTLSSLPDGSHTFAVRATDAAGNVDGTPASRTFTVDASAPNTTIDTGPADGSKTNNASPSFTFSSNEAGATFECKLDADAFSACTSPEAVGSLPDGPHTFQVRATDTGGNTDPTPAMSTFTVDTVAPDTSFTTGPTDGSTINNPDPSFDFSSTESGSTFECKLDAATFSSCTSPKVLSGLPDGPHTFAVRATDQAGNVDTTPVSRTFTVDATAPDTTIDSGPTEGSTITTDSTSFGFSADEAGSTFECKLDGAAFSSCTSPKALSGLSEGSHTFQVRATDAVSNTDATPDSRTFIVNTTPPNTTIDSGPTEGSTITTDSTSFGFSANEAGSTFECKLDGAAFSSCASPKTLSGLANGTHTFQVRATDLGGSTDATPESRTFTVAVPAPVIVPPAGGGGGGGGAGAGGGSSTPAPPTGSSPACDQAKAASAEAQRKFGKAKAKVKKAKVKVKQRKTDSTKDKLKKAKKKLKDAKGSFKKANAAASAACG